MSRIIPGWRCPYCLKQFPTEDEAEECASMCRRVENVIDVTIIICELCGEAYVDEPSAEECEEHHKELQDIHYHTWLVKENFRILSEAGNRPGQKKLGDIE